MSQVPYPPPNAQYPPPVAVTTSSSAIISLICGILGWLGVFGLGGLLAVIFGHVAKGEIKKSYGRVSGDGMATIGLVLGYANIILALIGLCLGVLIFAGAISAPLCMLPFMNEINSSFYYVP
ncbi:DUF4190 domain-containing protein [Levilinea saccharolytica]|uniref:DUF4190 domain-containing protein n=1 Tax=Levilinea saccharolytica TaxID=229921 RepID=A0A0P6Y4C1_9CHLR|nr:DUF4190 domain-containing protein [Levilinea saccharolytica]KPL79837.1 hypothetical protein ADN01_12855 [Levilinea saccharolytica]KPL79881.1 hypothetical protein ADN01_13220 [Levilinea saccharolytica]GAP16898.1 hypothetical protein LSAC_00755 [Levilinea saccharolytica]